MLVEKVRSSDRVRVKVKNMTTGVRWGNDRRRRGGLETEYCRGHPHGWEVTRNVYQKRVEGKAGVQRLNSSVSEYE